MWTLILVPLIVIAAGALCTRCFQVEPGDNEREDAEWMRAIK